MKRGLSWKLAAAVLLGATALPAASQPHIVGQWESVLWAGGGTWYPQLYAVHAMHLPTGKLLLFGLNHQAPQAMVWNFTAGTFEPVVIQAVTPGADPFCAGHTLLANGTVFLAGGHVDNFVGQPFTHVFHPFSGSSGQWQRLPNMQYARWYPTCTMLPDGRVFTASGPIGFSNGEVVWADTPEVYNPANNQWTTLPQATLATFWYPFHFILPNGKLFYAGPVLRIAFPRMMTYTLDTTTFTWTPVAESNIRGGNAVQYLPGKIMKCGGWENGTQNGEATPRTDLIDMNAATPVWRETAPMSIKRLDHNLVLLPDGKVLAIGGSVFSDDLESSQQQRMPEMWDPVTEQWTQLIQMTYPRPYHSTALLLPDGRVFTGGGNFSQSAQLYKPAYLFRGPQPAITSAPSVLYYLSKFRVYTPEVKSIEKVSLIRLGAVTHAFDASQMYIPLTFETRGDYLLVDMANTAAIAPPGYYMLFILNGQGVPSVGKYVRVGSPTAVLRGG